MMINAIKGKTYQAIVARPRRAAMQLNVIATIPRGVNPAGSGFGGTFSPVRSRKSTVFAAALPVEGVFPALQASRWFWGIV